MRVTVRAALLPAGTDEEDDHTFKNQLRKGHSVNLNKEKPRPPKPRTEYPARESQVELCQQAH